jgi:ATP-dependent DNA ligase
MNYESNNKSNLFERIVYINGGEGVVLKDISAPYGSGWVKVKKVQDDTVVIMGYTAGRNKYENMVGAIRFGQYVDGHLMELGQCSGIEDSFRLMLTKEGNSFIGRVMQIKFQERLASGKFREPRFMRLRPDLDGAATRSCVWMRKGA